MSISVGKEPKILVDSNKISGKEKTEIIEWIKKHKIILEKYYKEYVPTEQVHKELQESKAASLLLVIGDRDSRKLGNFYYSMNTYTVDKYKKPMLVFTKNPSRFSDYIIFDIKGNIKDVQGIYSDKDIEYLKGVIEKNKKPFKKLLNTIKKYHEFDQELMK